MRCVISDNDSFNQKSAYEFVIYKFIEAHLTEFGFIDAKTITKQFCIKRAKASSLIGRYRKLAPDNSIFSPERRRHEVTDTFLPIYLEDEPNEYLRLVQSIFDVRNTTRQGVIRYVTSLTNGS